MAIDLTQGSKSVSDIKEQARSPTDAKPSRVEKISAALNEIETSGTFPDCVTKTPGAFLWEFYKAWVENGGQDGGKNRNSIRRMRDHWLTGDTDVKSLHPKLTGRIRISKDDAKNLMTLFLGCWKFVGVKEGDWVLTADGYAPFQCRDCKKLCEMLADAMYPEGSEQIRIGLQLPVQHRERLEAQYIGSTVNEVDSLYLDSEAVIVLSRHNSVIGSTPVDSMKNFWHSMKYLYEKVENKKHVYIWIVDIGSRHVEEEEAWREFFNFEILKSQLRAFVTFDSREDDVSKSEDAKESLERSAIHDAFLRHLTIPEMQNRDKRWRWLCERSIFVVQNLRVEEFEDLYVDEDKATKKFRFRDTGVTSEHVLPNEIPYVWGQQRGSQELFRGRIDKMADATITVFLNSSSQNNLNDRSKIPSLRYFAHVPASDHTRDRKMQWSSPAISQEMVTPGALYDEAFRIVYWAACHRLGGIEARDEVYRENCEIALAYLARLGFRILRLPEFLKIHRTPSG